MTTRPLSLMLIASMTLSGALLAGSAHAEEDKLSKSEFQAVTYYKAALEHPQIQKLRSDKARIAAVAKDVKMSPKDLAHALEKVEAVGGDPSDSAVRAIKSGLDGLRVKGRVLDVTINAEEPKHVVAYVRWRGSSSADVLKEASEIAFVVKSEAPFVSTLSLAAMPPKGSTEGEAVWSAKIGHDPMSKIQLKRIEDYADRMYARLFEVVDNKPF